jgi:hypothetical protein
MLNGAPVSSTASRGASTFGNRKKQRNCTRGAISGPAGVTSAIGE